MLSRVNLRVLRRRPLFRALGGLFAWTGLPIEHAHADNDGSLCATTCERIESIIGTNHRHTLFVSVEDALAGREKSYDLRGASEHTHTLTLTPADFLALRSARAVRTTTTREGHLHRILVRCRPVVLPEEEVSALVVAIGGKDDHEIVVPRSHIETPRDRTYDIQGVAIHTHTLAISARGFRDLKASQKLTLTTGPGDNHTHVVALRLAKPI